MIVTLKKHLIKYGNEKKNQILCVMALSSTFWYEMERGCQNIVMTMQLF